MNALELACSLLYGAWVADCETTTPTPTTMPAEEALAFDVASNDRRYVVYVREVK